MKKFKHAIRVNKEIVGGQTVFKGTMEPIETLFNHMGKGVSLDEFLTDFPTLSYEQVTLSLDNEE